MTYGGAIIRHVLQITVQCVPVFRTPISAPRCPWVPAEAGGIRKHPRRISLYAHTGILHTWGYRIPQTIPSTSGGWPPRNLAGAEIHPQFTRLGDFTHPGNPPHNIARRDIGQRDPAPISSLPSCSLFLSCSFSFFFSLSLSFGVFPFHPFFVCHSFHFFFPFIFFLLLSDIRRFAINRRFLSEITGVALCPSYRNSLRRWARYLPDGSV